MGQTLLNTTDFQRELQLIFNQSASKQFSSPWTLEEYDGVGSSKSRYKVWFYAHLHYIISETFFLEGDVPRRCWELWI